MPSFLPTAAQLQWNGGLITLTPVRLPVTGANLAWAGGANVNMGTNFTSTLTDETVRLDRLMRGVPIAAPDGPSLQFQALWQRTVETIERAFARVNGVNTEQQSTLDAITAAMDLASAAKQQAQSLADEINLTTSRTDPIEGLLSASSSGVVTILAHSRVYGSGTTVAVSSGSVSGQLQSAFVRIYYNDPARVGGAVTYLATTDEITQTNNVHVVGGVAIPAAGEPPSTGIGTSPPGYVQDPSFNLP